MDAALEELWKKFNLSEDEKGVLSVNSQDVAQSKEQAQFSLLFRLQTNRDFNKEAFKTTLQQLWRGPHHVTIKEVGNNLFLAIFVTKEHMNDILDRSLWSFDKRLVLLKRFNGDVCPNKVSFQRSSFWIRVFNIPIKSMNSTIGNYISNGIEISILVDAPKSGLAWGHFLHIRVDIDITKPLMSGKMIHIEGMEKGGCISNMRGFLFIVIGVEFWDIKSMSVNMPGKGIFLQRRMTINLVLGFVLWVLRPIGGKTFTSVQTQRSRG
nr:hypothetical protein CFP56_06599 [Quercus suber]